MGGGLESRARLWCPETWGVWGGDRVGEKEGKTSHETD